MVRERRLTRVSIVMGAVALGVLALSGCGPSNKAADEQSTTSRGAATPEGAASQAESNAGAPAAESAQAAAPAALGICATCHATEAGKNLIGPSLFGVIGRKAGTEAGFTYSDAMKKSGITWDEQSLDAFIEKPQAKVPGTKMPFAGLSDAGQRHEIVQYLEKLK